MTEITQLIQLIEAGDQEASERLLPQVYEELRALAARWMEQEAPGQTLQATALVHEAYVRLVDQPEGEQWNSRGHFFGAAAEAMRRILIENARRKQQLKNGQGVQRIATSQILDQLAVKPEEFLEFNECLDRLELKDELAAKLVKLRYIVGLTMPECADTLELPLRSTERLWAFARSWLYRELNDHNDQS